MRKNCMKYEWWQVDKMEKRCCSIVVIIIYEGKTKKAFKKNRGVPPLSPLSLPLSLSLKKFPPLTQRDLKRLSLNGGTLRMIFYWKGVAMGAIFIDVSVSIVFLTYFFKFSNIFYHLNVKFYMNLRWNVGCFTFHIVPKHNLSLLIKNFFLKFLKITFLYFKSISNLTPFQNE